MYSRILPTILEILEDHLLSSYGAKGYHYCNE